MRCAVVMREKCYIPPDKVRKKRKMFSHTLLGPDEIRVLAGGAGYIKHIFVVARQSLRALPTHHFSPTSVRSKIIRPCED